MTTYTHQDRRRRSSSRPMESVSPYRRFGNPRGVPLRASARITPGLWITGIRRVTDGLAKNREVNSFQ